MRNTTFTLVAIIFSAITVFSQDNKPSYLPDGKVLIPASDTATVNSMPSKLAVSPDGRYVVSLNGGFGTPETGLRESLAVLDTSTNRVTDFPDDRLGEKSKQVYFLGLTFSVDGKHLYASMSSVTDAEGTKKDDTGNGIAVYSFDEGKVTPERFIKVPLQPLRPGKIAAKIIEKMPAGKVIPFPAGITVIPASNGTHERLLLADNLSDDALLLDAQTGEVLKRFDLSTEKVVPGSYPHSTIVSPDGKRGYVSLWNASRVAVLDLVAGQVITKIDVERPRTATASGSHPTEMVLSGEGRKLYVALANRDEVAVIDTQTNAVMQRLSTKLPGQEYLGGSPVSLALANDGRLYVANAGSDSVAVFNLRDKNAGRTMNPQGFIPTEWYPMALALRDGELFIASGKGRGMGPNNVALHDKKANKPFPYILSLTRGSIAHVKVPLEAANLAAFTKQAIADNHLDRKSTQLFASGNSPIKHVIYIIKENRSYDQVFGDLPNANGAPDWVMYGEQVTPNEHKLAREFGILDNFYDSGEVSGSGHNWSTSAAGSDYLEKTIPISYWGKERNYDYEGENNNRIPLDDDMPDVNETGTGYIWGNVASHHLTYRHYGEFVRTEWCNEKTAEASPMEGSPWNAANCPQKFIKKGQPTPANLGHESGAESPWPWEVPIIATNTATKPELRGHFDPKFPDFNLDYPDQWRADEFLQEFKKFVANRGKGAARELPNYILLRLGNDHTSGTKALKAAPSAAVSDNDLAVGRVVDAVSHSPYWDDTAILILEDDAQDGPDHVDAHRSIALLVSKYSPASEQKQLVENNFYCTVDMVRTLEVLLGLPPMNSNDAHASPIASVFSGKGDHAPYSADYRNLENGNLYKTNPPKGQGAAASAKMDFTHADRADTATLNLILWRAAKGEAPMPVTPGAAAKKDAR